MRGKIVPQPRLRNAVAAEHKDIYDAILARDTPAAVAALEKHYQATTNKF
jgi:DNA-binding GntR family transcriptional regulator